MALAEDEAVTADQVRLGRVDRQDDVEESGQDVGDREVAADVAEASVGDHRDDLAPLRPSAILEQFDFAVLGAGVDAEPETDAMLPPAVRRPSATCISIQL